MSKLASRFIKLLSIQKQKERNSSLAALDIDIGNQKDNISLGIGIVTRNILKYDVLFVPKHFFGNSRKLFSRTILGRLKCVIFWRLKCVI